MNEPLRFPPLTEGLKSLSFLTLLRFFGPGAIIASVTIGSGETVFASRGGALFGYTLLWCFIGGGLMKFVQVYTASRYITLTGEHPIERWKYLPGPHGWAVWTLTIISIICFPLWLSGLPKMLGSLMVWIFEMDSDTLWGDPRVWGTLIVIVAVSLTFIQSYKALEITQTFIVSLLLACILVAVFAIKPDWLAAFLGAVIPSKPTYEAWVHASYPAISSRSAWIELGTYLGAIGGGTQDYFGYLGMLREKEWGLLGRTSDDGPEGVKLADDEDNIKVGRRWLIAPLTDAVVSFSCVILFTIAFMVLGAAILHPQHIVPDGLQLLSVQAEFLTLLHPKLIYLYQIGVFMAFFGTIFAAYELYTRTTYECLRPIVPRIRNVPIAKIRPWVVAYCGLGGLAIMWMGGNPVQIVTPAAIFGGVLTCGLWCFLMIWTDRKYLPKPLQMGKTLLILNVISGSFLTIWGIRGIYDYLHNILVS